MTIDLNSEFNLAEVQQNIQELSAALLTAHPEMPSLLRKIHTKLKADPAIVTLLNEDEIAQVINGLKHVTNTQITGAAKEKKPAASKSATSRLNSILKSSGVSADDF